MSDVIRIENAEWSAAVEPRNGAKCISLRNKSYGASVLREPPSDREADSPFLYGIPILFPVNRIEGGEFEFEGRRYAFQINEPKTGCHLHGELHKAEFEVIAVTENSVKCRYLATDEKPYLSFPHRFEIVTEYALLSDGLHHTVTVTNLSDSNMPVFLGHHTTFNTLPTESSRPESIRVFADISEEYERKMEINYLPTGVKPPFDEASTLLAKGEYNPFDGRLSRHYRGKGAMAITDHGAGIRIVYENDEKYGFRLIYNGGSDGYICLEPQTCLANCQNSPFSRDEAGFDYIKPRESKTYLSRIFIEKIGAE